MTTVDDRYPGLGPLAGIHAGLLVAQFPLVWVVGCDLPDVDPGLAALNGAPPARVRSMGWVIGAMLASLAGILLAPLVTLDILLLTLLVRPLKMAKQAALKTVEA